MAHGSGPRLAALPNQNRLNRRTSQVPIKAPTHDGHSGAFLSKEEPACAPASFMACIAVFCFPPARRYPSQCAKTSTSSELQLQRNEKCATRSNKQNEVRRENLCGQARKDQLQHNPLRCCYQRSAKVFSCHHSHVVPSCLTSEMEGVKPGVKAPGLSC